jgi:hypothetical protein
MGPTQLKTGVQGGHVEHTGEIKVKVMEKEESGGREGRQKNQKSRWKKKEKKRIFGPSTSHENQPSCLAKMTLRVYLRTTCTSRKALYGHKRSTCLSYRNIVSTRVCANNFFSVVQNGSAVVPWHYRAREGIERNANVSISRFLELISVNWWYASQHLGER